LKGGRLNQARTKHDTNTDGVVMGSELSHFTLSFAFGQKTCVGGWAGNGGFYGTLADSCFRIVRLVTSDKPLTFYVSGNENPECSTLPNEAPSSSDSHMLALYDYVALSQKVDISLSKN